MEKICLIMVSLFLFGLLDTNENSVQASSRKLELDAPSPTLSGRNNINTHNFNGFLLKLISSFSFESSEYGKTLMFYTSSC